MGIFNNRLKNMFEQSTITELDDVNSLCFSDNSFCNVFATTLYSKIMHECADRAIIPNSIDKTDYTITTYNSYSPYKAGLVAWVVFAMVNQSQIFLHKDKIQGSQIYTFKKVNIQDATKDNGKKLKPDYIELDFREFKEAKIICLLFDLLGLVMDAMSKGVTASSGLILKIHELSQLIANGQNIAPLETQLKNINEGLKSGKSSYIDAKSNVEFLTYESETTEKTASYIFSLISTITGLPNSYLFGEVVGGLGDTSDGDELRLNSALKRYFYSIWQGVNYSVYGEAFEFKPLVSNVTQLVQMFTFIETTSLLNDAGKLKFMVNNTGFDEDDFNFASTSTSTATTTPTSNESETIDGNGGV